MIIFITGPVASGKSYISEILSMVSKRSAEMVRMSSEIKKTVGEGKLLESLKSEGNVPSSLDMVATEIVVRKACEDAPTSRTVIIDGFPRNRGQVDFLSKWKYNEEILVLFITANHEIRKERVKIRLKEMDLARSVTPEEDTEFNELIKYSESIGSVPMMVIENIWGDR